MRRLVLVILLLWLAGCGGGGGGGGSASEGGSAAPAAGAGGTSAPVAGSTAGQTGLAVSVKVLSPSQRIVAQAAAVLQEVLIDVLDPNTLQPIIPTTTVTNNGQANQDVQISVPVGTWILRVQGRAADGTAAGTRYQNLVVVTEGQTTSIQAILNPVPTLASIQVNPGPAASVSLGTTQQFIATGVLTDLTTQDITSTVTWTSSNPSVASISATGLASTQGLAAGTTTITASLQGLTGNSTLAVNPVALSSLQITPGSLTVAPGVSSQLTCTGIFADNSHQDLTNSVTWTSSSTGIASVSATGSLTGVAPGNTTINATFSGISASSNVTVARLLTRIDLSPTSANLPVGHTQQLKATGTFNDNTTQDLTSTATWASTAPAVANVSTTGLVTALVQGSVNVTATSANITGSSSITVPPAVLVSLQVNPSSSASIPQGATLAFNATGTFSDGSTRDLTSQVTWTSNNTAVAAISNAAGSQGVATGVAPGSTVIEATQDAISSAVPVKVTGSTLTELTISPTFPSVQAGGSLTFKATGTFNDGSTIDLTGNVTWTSVGGSISNSAGSQGQFTAAGGSGSDTVTAAVGTLTATTTVSVSVLPSGPAPPAPPAPPPTALGILYVADPAAGNLSLFSNPSSLTGAVAATLTTTTGLFHPSAVALDAGRNILYVADPGNTGGNGNGAVLVYSPANTLGGGTPTATLFGFASTLDGEIAVDPTTNCLYVSENAGGQIELFTGASSLTSPVSGQGTVTLGMISPPRALTRFAPTPTGLAVDPTQNRVFAPDVNRFTPTLAYFNSASTTFVGGPHSFFPFTPGQFGNSLQGGTTGAATQVDFVDQLVYIAEGTSLFCYLAPSNAGYLGDGSPAIFNFGAFTAIGESFVDTSRNQIYVSDSGAGTISVFTSATTAPTLSQTLTGFTSPKGIWIDLTH